LTIEQIVLGPPEYSHWKAGIDDKDNYHSFICWRTRPIRNAFLPSIALSNSKAIAKPFHSSNPFQRIMAFD
tara:strand:+ start:247 stop:459 length:213 start_codon:yes stop_codon:yes gene_type:complete